MPSFLARLRNRVTSKSSTQSAPPTPKSTAAQQDDHDDIPNVLPALPIDRKIRPDLTTLLEAYAAEDAANRNDHTSSQRPSVNEESGSIPLKPRSSGRLLIKKEHHELTAASLLSPTRGRPLVPRVSEPPPPGGTFGRHSRNFLQPAPSTSFNSLPSRTHPSDGKENDRSFPLHRWKTRPSTAPNPQNRLVASPETPPSSTSEYPQTDSSIKTPNRSHSPSTKTHSSRSSKSRSVRISTPVTNHLGSDSPRTTSYPTPPGVHAPSSSVTVSLPPPLPPLDHPELSSHAALSQSSTFGKSVRPYSSLPKVHSLFASSSSDQGFSGRYSHRRVNTMSSTSTKTSRRSSAEWSANQATVGVLSNSGSWPAEVSREILRFSFNKADVSHQDPGIVRSSHVVGAPGVQETTGQAFPPPSLFSSSLGSPIFLQSAEPVANLSDFGGDHVPIGVEDNETMGQQENDVVESGNVQRNSSSKGKAPLKSSLRTSSSPVSHASTSNSASGPFISFAGVTTELLAPESSKDVLNSPGSKGKRKADEVDITPPDRKRVHAKFAVPGEKPRQGSSDPHAPSSYRVKRARLSLTTPPPSPSRQGSSVNATNTGSWNSGTSSQNQSASRHLSITHPHNTKQSGAHAGSVRSNAGTSDGTRTPRRRRSMSSLSHGSIPLSALVSPHAPSVSRSVNNAYHMRDPRKLPKVKSTPWSLKFRTEEEDGSPVHAWFFFIGFVVFPMWWVASVWRIPTTRQVGVEDMEKAVTLDDPQVEHDARSWRFRCRIMTVVSIFTYIPFIVLVAIFAPR